MAALFARPLGNFISGILAEYLSISLIFLFMGIIIAIVCFSLLFYKDFRNA